MEKTINRIIDIEMKAQSIVHEAEKQRDGLEDKLKLELAKLERAVEARIKARLDALTADEEKWRGERFAELDAEHEAEMAKLRAAESEIAGWAGEITRRALSLKS